MPELIGGASGLGWVAVKAVLLFAVAVIGLRLGERRTLAQLSAFDFAVAVAVGAIIGRGATASGTSFATSAVALVTFLVAHRVVAILRRHSQAGELARAGLTAADVYALLREKGVGESRPGRIPALRGTRCRDAGGRRQRTWPAGAGRARRFRVPPGAPQARLARQLPRVKAGMTS